LKSIGIICCFFGPWPRWGNLFLESCRRNPTVDFFLVTDCAIPLRDAPNIKIVDLDVPRFNALATEKLGIQVKVRRPYKIVDFRPAFGVLFREFLEKYDFWGYCDLDVIFGDIRSFLTGELLDQYDVIATRKEIVTGHFTLFRNEDRITRIYQRSRDLEKVFGSEGITAFDECGWGIHFQLLRGQPFSEVASQAKIDSLMHVLDRSPDVRVHRKTIMDEHLPFRESFASRIKEVRWDNGKMVDVPTGRELMYYHLQYLKEEPGFYVPEWETMPYAFLLKPRGVYWVGEEDRARRLATAVRRGAYLVGRSIALYPRYYVGQLLRALRPRPRG
jgi:hypothetical protein